MCCLQPTSKAPLPTQQGGAYLGMAAAFAVLALVSCDCRPVGLRMPPSIASLCSVRPLPESRRLSTRVAQLVLPQSGQWPRCQHWPSAAPASLEGARILLQLV